MKKLNLNNYLKGLLYFFVPFLTLLFIITIFYYFDILNNHIIKYFKIIILLISSLSGGIYIGKKSTNKGYLNGLKLGGIIGGVFLLINIILGGFKFYHLIYYLIMIITICLGSILGINKKN